MKTYNVKLTPLSSMHLFPLSDTLFGATCWGIKTLYGEEKLHESLKAFDSGEPVFVLSSSFPHLVNENGEAICFYPKPANAGLSAKDIEEIAGTIGGKNIKRAVPGLVTKYKKFKKAEYLSETLFINTVNGASERSLFEDYLNSKIKSVGSMLMSDTENTSIPGGGDSKIYRSATIQKNLIDRITMTTGEEGQTFYQHEIYTANKFSLHFFVMTTDIDFLKPVFKYLEDKGIGGNRSTGKGGFKIEVIGEKTLPYITSSQTFVSLSRYIPQRDEIEWEDDRNFYVVFPYRSKVESDGEFKGEDVWKSRVMYLKEGSCLKAKNKKEFYGRTPVAKEIGVYKIYQNGMTLPVFGNFGGKT